MTEKITVRKRYLTIDILKGIAALSVLLGHAIQRGLGINGGDFFKDPLFKIIYSFHMPLFILISGYVLNKYTSNYNFKFFLKKLRRLIIPTIVWSYIIWGIKDYSFVGIKEFIMLDYSFIDFTKMIFLYPTLIIWFLYTIFIFDIFYILIRNINKNKIVYIDIIICIIIQLLLEIIPTQYFGVNYLRLYFPIFVFGYYLNIDYLKKIKIKNILLLLILYFVLLYLFKDTFITNTSQFYIISLIAIYLLYQVVIRIENKVINNILAFFGKLSMELYLSQCVCLNIGIGAKYVRVISIFLSATIISLIIIVVVNHVPFFKFLLYGKRENE